MNHNFASSVKIHACRIVIVNMVYLRGSQEDSSNDQPDQSLLPREPELPRTLQSTALHGIGQEHIWQGRYRSVQKCRFDANPGMRLQKCSSRKSASEVRCARHADRV